MPNDHSPEDQTGQIQEGAGFGDLQNPDLQNPDLQSYEDQLRRDVKHLAGEFRNEQSRLLNSLPSTQPAPMVEQGILQDRTGLDDPLYSTSFLGTSSSYFPPGELATPGTYCETYTTRPAPPLDIQMGGMHDPKDPLDNLDRFQHRNPALEELLMRLERKVDALDRRSREPVDAASMGAPLPMNFMERVDRDLDRLDQRIAQIEDKLGVGAGETLREALASLGITVTGDTPKPRTAPFVRPVDVAQGNRIVWYGIGIVGREEDLMSWVQRCGGELGAYWWIQDRGPAPVRNSHILNVIDFRPFGFCLDPDRLNKDRTPGDWTNALAVVPGTPLPYIFLEDILEKEPEN